MKTIVYRPASRWWQWSALAFVFVGGVVPLCLVTFGMGWEEFGRRFWAEPRGSDLRELTVALGVCVPLAVVLYYCMARRTYVSAEGIRVRTPLRRRRIAWHDVTGLGVGRSEGMSLYGRTGTPHHRIRVDLASGERIFLPAPVKEEFDSAMEAAKGEMIRRWKAATASAQQPAGLAGPADPADPAG
ncbi:PH domain-containing protein [Streptomyces chrestomyceticus]|uniref:PH domain-containing protein n=1 Tax=Streptomyces chrestomyceticus TaxID=68185 RepID=UPI0035A976FE